MISSEEKQVEVTRSKLALLEQTLSEAQKEPRLEHRSISE
jgi:hypothetical protein